MVLKLGFHSAVQGVEWMNLSWQDLRTAVSIREMLLSSFSFIEALCKNLLDKITAITVVAG